MLNANELIARHGLDAARRLAASKAERSCIEAAAALLAAGPCNAADIAYAVLGSSCLPHKSIDRSAQPGHWVGRIDDVTVAMDSGRYDDGAPIGIPFGSKARIIMVYLTTAAVLSASPQIELGASMYGWLRTMNAGRFGGMTYRLFAEQARRIAAMTVHARVEAGEAPLALSGHSIAGFVRQDAAPDAAAIYRARTPVAFPQFAVLDRGYWLASKQHSCAIRLSALRQLCNNSTAIDLYVWLAHRLPQLRRGEIVRWTELHAMFGSGYRHLRQMKAPFTGALELAVAVYPQAQVTCDDAGIALLPSAPPVPASLALRPASA